MTGEFFCRPADGQPRTAQADVEVLCDRRGGPGDRRRCVGLACRGEVVRRCHAEYDRREHSAQRVVDGGEVGAGSGAVGAVGQVLFDLAALTS